MTSTRVLSVMNLSLVIPKVVAMGYFEELSTQLNDSTSLKAVQHTKDAGGFFFPTPKTYWKFSVYIL